MTSMNNVNLDKGTVDVAEYSQTEAALAALREKYSTLPDINTPDGYEFHKTGIKELTTLRTSLEAARKREKEPHLLAGRIIDDEAKRITAELVKLEDPMKAAKKEYDDRVERERQERIARLQVKVDAIKAMPGQVRGQSSQAIAEMIDRVGEIDAAHDFYDLTKEAMAARQSALDELAQMLIDRQAFEAAEEDRKKAEAEKARLEQELAQQRAEMQRQQDEMRRQQEDLQRQREELERAQAALQPAAPAPESAKAEATAEVVAAKPAAAPAQAASKSKIDNRQWHAVVTDKSALIAAIAAGYGTEDLLIVDQAALDSLANDKRNDLELPGVVAQPVPTTNAA
ncbi:hypothetical protein [Pseudomonas sp. UBA7530]|uniref:hypothetical protein n=1 Tax=Pseudomonas sp. UBA7530 TaxID=1947341 RepID=UPI0025FD4BF6|nr:hypothetical protein [Pseudomonas sp. UBA7530]